MINSALHTIFPIAGWPAERAREVEISGGADPILPTPFRIAETSTAALAAVGLAASDLWELRTGRRAEAVSSTPAEYANIIKFEIAKTSKLIKDANIRVD